MGQAASVEVRAGSAALIHTGGMLPPGADAVVMVEHTQYFDDRTIEVLKPVAPGENALQIGEDVEPDSEILPAGHLIQPQDVGALLALGITHNSGTIQALCHRAGAATAVHAIIPDVPDALYQALITALPQSDMMVVTAGSSVSVRDMTAATFDRLGEPGVLVHGVAARPGKPTILAVVDGKPIIGLPGNPVSAMVMFTLFGVR